MPRKKEKTIRKTTGKGGNYRKTKSGAGMTKKGVAAYRKANPGSKLKTAVTGKVKKGSKICPSGKAWAKRTFDTYPSAYANMAASKYCKDPNYAKGAKGKKKKKS